MTNERLEEIDLEYAKITDLTGNAEWIPELVAAVRTLTASLAEVTRERDEADKMCEEMRLSFPTTAQIMVSMSIEMSHVSCLKFIRAEADFVDSDEEKRIHEAIDKALMGQSIPDKRLIDLQSQLTTAHLDNERLRKALTIGLDSLEKSTVVAIDSCDCHGCKAVRSIRQALATPTPNPIEQELKELRRSTKVGVTAVIRNGRGGILLGLKGRACSKELEGKWVTPGGRVNFEETIDAAVMREVREETGVAIQIVRWLPPQELIQCDLHFVFFVCEAIATNCDNLKAGDDLTEVRWFDEQSTTAIDADITPITRLAIDSMFKEGILRDSASKERTAHE